MKFPEIRHRRVALSAVAVFLLIAFITYVWAGTLTAASGGATISADTAATGGTGAWTALSGPTYAETINGDIASGGYVTLTAPAGFEFNTGGLVSVALITGDSKNAAANMNGTPVGGNVATTANGTLAVTATTISFFVNTKSRGNTLNTIQWQGIQVRPTNGSPLASGNIIFTLPAGSTAPSSTNAGTLIEVAGAMAKLLTVLPGQIFTSGTGVTGTASNQTAGTAFNLTQLVATDQFNNVVTAYGGAKTISYTGPSSGCSISPLYTTSVSFSGGVSTTALATTLKKAETTSIIASDGTVTGPASSSLLVNPSAISQLVVTLPGQSFSACTGNTGTPSSQAAGIAFTIPAITATDAYFNIISTYAGAKTLAYSGPSGAAAYTTSVNFTGGQSTTALTTTISTAQTTTISVSDGATSGPASSSFTVNPTVNSFNAFESSTVAGAVSGIIKTKISGTAFALDIVALTTAPAVSAGFTGTVKVELVDSSSGSTCSIWPAIQTLANQTFSSTDQGRHAIPSITEVNAWKNVRMRISYPVTAPTIISCSSDNFAIRPSTLAVAATDQDWQTAGTINPLNNTGLGGVVHKAGQPFTIKATAKNSAGATTANYAGTPVSTISQCGTGTAVCPVTANLGALSVGPWSAGSGTVTTSTATYSDVGAFAMVLQDTSFADVDLADSTLTERSVTAAAVNVGRFVPDHFAVTTGAITPRTDLAACSASVFSYMNEPFGITFQLTAQNAAPANGTTKNYAGALALAPTDPTFPSFLNVGAVDTITPTPLVAPITAITLANPGKVTTGTLHGLTTGGRVYLSGVRGMTGINNALYTVTVIDAYNFTVGVNTSGFGTYTAGGNASRVAVTASTGAWSNGTVNISSTIALQRAAQPDGPFNNVAIGIAPQDADGVQAQGVNLDADNNGSNERVNIGTAQLRFGRLTLKNAHGSELYNLRIYPVQTQYWNGSYFLTNAQDNCTSISSAGNVVFGNYQGGITAANMVSPGNVLVGGTFNSGIGSLLLTKPLPQPAAKGSVDLTLDLAAENKTYLQGNWSAAAYNQNPVSRATFGIYKDAPIIYMREMH